MVVILYLRYKVVFYPIRVYAVCRGVRQILTLKLCNICKMQRFHFLSPKLTERLYHVKAFFRHGFLRSTRCYFWFNHNFLNKLFITIGYNISDSLTNSDLMVNFYICVLKMYFISFEFLRYVEAFAGY